mmetsp:Transcript_62035/g.128346  ORF Transcript_62035/g.128346 Transcript_62035/m.128346 type:complete len:138 (+) Transcript_62035:1014-1427(+)
MIPHVYVLGSLPKDRFPRQEYAGRVVLVDTRQPVLASFVTATEMSGRDQQLRKSRLPRSLRYSLSSSGSRSLATSFSPTVNFSSIGVLVGCQRSPPNVVAKRSMYAAVLVAFLLVDNLCLQQFSSTRELAHGLPHTT